MVIEKRFDKKDMLVTIGVAKHHVTFSDGAFVPKTESAQLREYLLSRKLPEAMTERFRANEIANRVRFRNDSVPGMLTDQAKGGNNNGFNTSPKGRSHGVTKLSCKLPNAGKGEGTGIEAFVKGFLQKQHPARSVVGLRLNPLLAGKAKRALRVAMEHHIVPRENAVSDLVCLTPPLLGGWKLAVDEDSLPVRNPKGL